MADLQFTMREAARSHTAAFGWRTWSSFTTVGWSQRVWFSSGRRPRAGAGP